ncbi:hypothetical protein D5H75_33445 [Bailinhaonella thermotolerans]|uniref:Alkyl sulfatase dimerisation domain-containing protein n=2 Tax=Bailinhaonella thermotolerans TaxID=1070861 RepID=A0A3A4AB80_9ACTN|nr:hypothetical protein D5H75_33445 [Bailinhaonella thermotolerans]
MAALGAAHVIPGHGDAVDGVEAIRDELLTLAEYLRHIVRHALDGLNAGHAPDHIVETLVIPPRLAAHPRLQPVYDQPEFICRNVIRRYGGWWDGHPANILPAPAADRAREIARLAGGVGALVARARALAESDLRLACHLAEWAFLADQADLAAQDCYADLFDRRARTETSIMAKMALGQPRMLVEALRASSS